ncbi:MAG: nicotinate-nucleotide--dimethylbenzimidazole phosphoribosyltransferase [Lachnospiraceae bacterium]
MKLEETIKSIRPLDAIAMTACKEKWNGLVKPIHGFGRFEDTFMQIAGIQRSENIFIENKKLIIMCADNGVVEEGVSQTGSETTAKIARRFKNGSTCSAVMAKKAGVEIIPIDIGMIEDVGLSSYKVRCGTDNMVHGPAMTREEAVQAIEAGIQIACDCKNQGTHLLVAGDLGIGNTTTASAITSVCTGESVDAVTGRGAGLEFEGFKRKKEAIRTAIEKNKPNSKDVLDVLAKVGGLDIAGLVGIYLGGAACGIPIVIDGYASAVAAFLANRLSPMIGSYVIPFHITKEPGMEAIFKKLSITPLFYGEMGVGEGTGAVLLLPLLDMMKEVYDGADTFEEAEILPYQVFGCH